MEKHQAGGMAGVFFLFSVPASSRLNRYMPLTS